MDFKNIEAKFKAFMGTGGNGVEVNKNQNASFAETSIFLNHDDVNLFVEKQYGFDADNMTMSLKDLSDMEVKNGQFVEFADFDPDDIEIEEDRASSFLKAIGIDTGNELSETAKDDIGLTMTDVINEVLSDKEMQKAIDVDGNGELSGSEIKDFLTSAAAIDGNDKDLSLEDILAAVDAVKNADKIAKAIDEEEKAKELLSQSQDVSVPQNTGGVSGGGGYYGASSGGGITSGGGVSTSTNNTAGNAGGTNLDNMTKEQLQSELSSANGDLTAKQEKLSAILDGSDPSIQKLQDAVDEAYEKWQDELKSVDEETAKQVKKLNDDISAKEAEISTTEDAISQAECSLSDAKTAYDNAKGATANLQNILSSLKSQNSENNDVSGQIADVEAKIAESQRAESEAQTAIDDAQTELDKLKEEKEKLQSQLGDLNGQMSELQEEIITKHPEMKEYVENYKEAKEALTEQKASAAESAKSEVVEAQKRVDEVQKAISNIENKETTSEYTVTSLPKDIQERLDSKLGVGFTAKLEEMCKRLNCDPEDMLRVMSSESGLNPQAGNPNGGAIGLIQIMPSVAANLGTSSAELAKMNGVQQLDYVEKCFSSWLDGSQKVSAGRLYAYNFLPGRVTGDDSAALTTSGEGYYSANAGLDTNKDGKITIDDLTQRLNNIDYRSFI